MYYQKYKQEHKHGGSNISLSKKPQNPKITSIRRNEKKEYEVFLDNIQNHVTISWVSGNDIGYVISNLKNPYMKEPTNMTNEENKLE